MVLSKLIPQQQDNLIQTDDKQISQTFKPQIKLLLRNINSGAD